MARSRTTCCKWGWTRVQHINLQRRPEVQYRRQESAQALWRMSAMDRQSDSGPPHPPNDQYQRLHYRTYCETGEAENEI